MKTLIIISLLLIALAVVAGEDTQQRRSKSEWYQHFDARLTVLAKQLASDMEARHQQQRALAEEMHRLNS